MPDSHLRRVDIERVEDRSIVSLKVAGRSAPHARERLQLAPALRLTNSNPNSLWVAANHWLLVSDTTTPEGIIAHCREALSDLAHLAIDQSSGLIAIRIVGPGARDLLAADCGLDLRPGKFPAGMCCRTRLARIAAVVVADADDPGQLTIYVDRSYETYMHEWLTDSINIADGLFADHD